MKALSYINPYGFLMAVDEKRYETRSRAIYYRGMIAIHSSKNFPWVYRESCGDMPFRQVLLKHGIKRPEDLPRQAIIGLIRIVDCYATEYLQKNVQLTIQELAFGNFGPGRYATKMIDPILLPEPIPCKGQTMLWEVPKEVVAKIREQVTLPDRYVQS